MNFQTETMEREMSPQESLSIIRSMIDKTKHSLSDGSHYFLLWGYAVFLGCIIQYSLLAMGYHRHYFAWSIILVAIAMHNVFIFRDAKKQKAITFIEEANGQLWMGVGIAFGVMSVLFIKIGYQYCFPFYILFYGVGSFISGNLIKFKPLIIGGIVCYILAAVAVFTSYPTQILISAISILISYIIPGHILRNRYRKNSLS
jgi:hypothetical protein